MKVRPSVKPICEKCKIIRRKGKVMVICQKPEAQAEAGLKSAFGAFIGDLQKSPYIQKRSS